MDIHFIQTEILRKLSLTMGLKFNQLLVHDLQSVHVNYHLQKLVSLKLVKKENGIYHLTNLGKDHTNQIDDIARNIEKQPKTSILITGARQRGVTGEIEFLLTKRLKHPFFGKVAELTGKVKFGETFEQAARRELFEETGLTAKNFVLEKIGRVLRKDSEDNILQDVIFYEFFVTDFSGVLIEKLPYQENFWMTEKEFERLDPSEILTGTHIVSRNQPKELKIKEYITNEYGY